MKDYLYPKILHHGAVTGVTGSCHELQFDENKSILIDCGIFQGSDQSPHGQADAANLELDFSISLVKALVVTHCHIDHAGRIPWLLAAGFDGPIFCSYPTATLLPLMLADAAKIGITRDKRIIKKLVAKVESMLKPVEYNEWAEINHLLSIRLQRAGHILGSAYVECDAKHDASKQNKRIVFSGDLGAPHAPLLPAPVSPEKCDVLIIESTYGDKNHEERINRKSRLKAIIERCFQDKGVVLIPAFSLGRTQELMYEFEQIIHEESSSEGKDDESNQWRHIEVILDSPLANRLTKAYRDLKPYWDEEAQDVIKQGRYPLTFNQLYPIESHNDHKSTVKYLKKSARPTLVIAASGMCNGGRITRYLKALLADKRTDILFTGYQARNSLGRQILKQGPKNGWVKIDDEKYTIHAKVHQIGGYSAHADQQNLLDFIEKIAVHPEEIRIVHGDQGAKNSLKEEILKIRGNANILIPNK